MYVFIVLCVCVCVHASVWRCGIHINILAYCFADSYSLSDIEQAAVQMEYEIFQSSKRPETYKIAVQKKVFY